MPRLNYAIVFKWLNLAYMKSCACSVELCFDIFSHESAIKFGLQIYAKEIMSV